MIQAEIQNFVDALLDPQSTQHYEMDRHDNGDISTSWLVDRKWFYKLITNSTTQTICIVRVQMEPDPTHVEGDDYETKVFAMNFILPMTEEQYFQFSTVHDIGDFELDFLNTLPSYFGLKWE